MCCCRCADVYGSIAVVRAWVASGTDVNVADADGDTALMEYARCNKPEYVAEMLRLGADTHRVNNNGLTAAQLAPQSAELVRLLGPAPA